MQRSSKVGSGRARSPSPKQEPEKHEFRFRGLWIPKDIVGLLTSGEITPVEVLLLAVVDGLVGEEGCWASNAYLARLSGVKVRRIQYIIADLVQKGLLIRVGVKRVQGRDLRVLETCYSQIVYKHTDAKNCMGGVQDNAPNLQTLSESSVIDDMSISHEIDQAGGTMLFRDAHPVKKETKYTPTKEDKSRAKKLCAALKTHHLLSPGIKPVKWAEWFTRLRLVKLVPEEELDKTLDWFCRYAKDKYTPKARAGKSFYTKYDAIRDAVKRLEGELARVEISTRAKSLAERHSRKGWPGDSAKDLPIYVQITVNSYSAFLAKLKDFCSANPERIRTGKNTYKSADPHVRFAYHLLASDYTGGIGYAEQRLDELLSYVRYLADAGKAVPPLPKLAWTGDLDEKQFSGLMVKKAASFSGSADRWFKLKERLA